MVPMTFEKQNSKLFHFIFKCLIILLVIFLIEAFFVWIPTHKNMDTHIDQLWAHLGKL